MLKFMLMTQWSNVALLEMCTPVRSVPYDQWLLP